MKRIKYKSPELEVVEMKLAEAVVDTSPSYGGHAEPFGSRRSYGNEYGW